MRPEKKAARCEASWTESVKAIVFVGRCRPGRIEEGRQRYWPSDATAVPRNRIASRSPHAGHTEFLASSSVVVTSTGTESSVGAGSSSWLVGLRWTTPGTLGLARSRVTISGLWLTAAW